MRTESVVVGIGPAPERATGALLHHWAPIPLSSCRWCSWSRRTPNMYLYLTSRISDSWQHRSPLLLLVETCTSNDAFCRTMLAVNERCEGGGRVALRLRLCGDPDVIST